MSVPDCPATMRFQSSDCSHVPMRFRFSDRHCGWVNLHRRAGHLAMWFGNWAWVCEGGRSAGNGGSQRGCRVPNLSGLFLSMKHIELFEVLERLFPFPLVRPWES